MVEAAFVIPVIILVIASLLTLMIYFYICLQNQISTQKEITAQSGKNDYVIEIVEKTKETSYETEGLINHIMKNRYKVRTYALRESVIIRTGDKIGEIIWERKAQ